MRTLVKLLIAAAILNAAARGGAAAVTYYQLKDGAEQILLFGASATPDVLHGQIIRKAAELGAPLEPERLTVDRDGPRTTARGAYTQPVELFPSYIYPFECSFTAEAFSVGPIAPAGRRP